MLWINLKIALLVFFGWFAVDSIVSILGKPMEGIFYPMASGRLKSIGADWTQKPWFGAPMYLTLFAGVWLSFLWRGGLLAGARIAALITAFVMPPFWIVSSVSADMYDLELNGYWLASMVYCNFSFFLSGFLGSGRAEDLYF